MYFQACGKTFRDMDSFRQHQRSHLEESFVCDVCGKDFSSLKRCNYHRKMHSDVYHWSCYYCEEKYRSLRAFKTHLSKFHPQMKSDLEKRSSIKLHQCQICFKVYGLKGDLQRHLYIHDGLKPFDCDYCNKSFNDKNNLRVHMRRMHSGDTRDIECFYCCKKYVNQEAFRLHLKKIHGIDNIHPEEVEIENA